MAPASVLNPRMKRDTVTAKKMMPEEPDRVARPGDLLEIKKGGKEGKPV